MTAEERIGTFAPQAVYPSSAGCALTYPQALLVFSIWCSVGVPRLIRLKNQNVIILKPTNSARTTTNSAINSYKFGGLLTYLNYNKLQNYLYYVGVEKI
jgi:hypothetical protein